MSTSSPQTPKKYAFDLKDPSTFKRYRVGVWEIYKPVSTDHLHISWAWKPWSEWPVVSQWISIYNNASYLLQTLKDVLTLKGTPGLLLAVVLCELGLSLLPALDLASQGNLLAMVRLAVEEQRVDQWLLLTASASSLFTTQASARIREVKNQYSKKLRLQIKGFYAVQLFNAFGRLDVPTFDDPMIQSDLEAYKEEESGAQTIVWNAIYSIVFTSSVVVKLLTQLFVLYRILKDQPSGLAMAILSGAYMALFYGINLQRSDRYGWAASAVDADYIRSQGLLKLVQRSEHRKELVASGIHLFLTSLYTNILSRLGPDAVEEPWEQIPSDIAAQQGTAYSEFLLEVLRVLPDVAVAVHAIHRPATIAVSVASLQLTQRTVQTLGATCRTLKRNITHLEDTLNSVKKLKEIAKLPNRVRATLPGDGTGVDDPDNPLLGVPFPEDTQTLSFGISVEFCSVSFKYPESDTWVLRDVSFRLERGQLCVIVGNNGSGKSTILKLVSRLYDPTEGQILIDGHDIKTLRLQDLRSAISILFQDYSIFPLSLRDNIGIGDPVHFSHLDVIQQAAELGGAAGFIEKLPEGYDAYLERPVADLFDGYYKGPPNLFGRPNEDGTISNSNYKKDLSGGQKQRVALSRTFMSTLAEEDGVGLLVFDEPSASLDPTAEHDLFERLRKLRGNKTMIFSSHRFGNLTRHADLILYVHESQVIEAGTHNQLLRRNGEYKRIWMLQAQAFL